MKLYLPETYLLDHPYNAIQADAWAGEAVYDEEMAAMIELPQAVYADRMEWIKDAVEKIQSHE